MSIAAQQVLQARALNERIIKDRIQTEHVLRCTLQGHFADPGSTVCRFCGFEAYEPRTPKTAPSLVAYRAALQRVRECWQVIDSATPDTRADADKALRVARDAESVARQLYIDAVLLEAGAEL